MIPNEYSKAISDYLNEVQSDYLKDPNKKTNPQPLDKNILKKIKIIPYYPKNGNPYNIVREPSKTVISNNNAKLIATRRFKNLYPEVTNFSDDPTYIKMLQDLKKQINNIRTIKEDTRTNNEKAKNLTNMRQQFIEDSIASSASRKTENSQKPALTESNVLHLIPSKFLTKNEEKKIKLKKLAQIRDKHTYYKALTEEQQQLEDIRKLEEKHKKELKEEEEERLQKMGRQERGPNQYVSLLPANPIYAGPQSHTDVHGNSSTNTSSQIKLNLNPSYVNNGRGRSSNNDVVEV